MCNLYGVEMRLLTESEGKKTHAVFLKEKRKQMRDIPNGIILNKIPICIF